MRSIEGRIERLEELMAAGELPESTIRLTIALSNGVQIAVFEVRG